MTEREEQTQKETVHLLAPSPNDRNNLSWAEAEARAQVGGPSLAAFLGTLAESWTGGRGARTHVLK